MKICWDNLENVRLTRKGNLKITSCVHVEMDSCETCGNPYLTQKRKHMSRTCSHSCARIGKIHPEETRKKIGERSYAGQSGSLHPNYKGSKMFGIALYDTYKNTLGIYEDIRKQEDTEALEVRCVYCAQWFAPTYASVRNRFVAINNLNRGENRLYCSENCKQSCPTYNQAKYPKGLKHATSREVSTYLRQMVFERDNWICQKCGNTIEDVPLHVHHMDPVAQNPMFQNDMDSCITLCKDCHKEVHMQYGCRYVDLQCKEEK